MRAALLAALLSCACAAPLAAQEAAPPAPAATTPEADPVPGAITLVTASEALLARHGVDPLHPDTSLCLGKGESLLLASDRVIVEIASEGCHTAGEVERNAFAAEQRELHTHLIEQAQAEHVAAIEGGDTAVIERAHLKLKEAQRKGAEKGVYVAPPLSTRGIAAAAPAAPKRTRTGAIRASARPATPPRPVIFRLANASPAVLKRHPRGTLVQRTTALCLNPGEEATIVGSNGQSVSYSGPGCLNRKAKPTSTNIGGFTFGWAKPKGRAVPERA